MNSPLLRQTWTMSAVLINMFGQAMVLSFPSSLLPALNATDSSIKVDLDTSSWLGSIVGVAGVPGFLMSSFLMDVYGRRISHGIFILPGVLGWILIYFAENVTALMIGRLLGGLSSTATVSLGAIIIGEYTSPNYRGVFLYLKNAMVCLGATCTHIASRYLHWRTISLIALVPLAISLVITYMWPESPAWLLFKQDYETCEETFYWLRGRNPVCALELKQTINAQKEQLENPKVKLSILVKVKHFFLKFSQKDFRKPFIIMILSTLVLEVSGRHIFPAYAVQIMTALTGEKTHSFFYMLSIDLIITLSAIFASVLGKIMNRRTLLFWSGFTAFIIITFVCLYLFLASRDIISSERPLVPTCFLILYFILANLGCAPIPLALVGEVFPLAHRGVGLGLSGVWISIILLFALKATPYMLDRIHVYGLFTVNGLIMCGCLIILYFIMPETKDRTLQEIENYFKHGKYTDPVSDKEETNTMMIRVDDS